MKRSTDKLDLSATKQMKAFRMEAEEIVRQVPRKVTASVAALSANEVQRVLHDLQVQQIELELQND